MKKNLFYLLALICSVSLFSACSDDDNNGNGGDGATISPYAGTYRLADYVTEDIPGEEGKVKKNIPVSGALYFDWQLTEPDAFVDNMKPLIRHIGSSLLPAALNTITLDEKGDVLADYMVKPTIQLDMTTIMGMFTGMVEYPTKENVVAKFPTSGFVSSSAGLASWEEKNGLFTLKFDIANILSAALGGSDTSDIAGIIDQVLNNSTPADIKQLLGTVLGGADLSGIQDATITQLLGWCKNGIPMNLRTLDNGHTLIVLNKSAFDNFFTPHESGETDDWGDPKMTCDILILWEALVTANLIPQEAKDASAMLNILMSYWPKTQIFDLGFDLVKK